MSYRHFSLQDLQDKFAVQFKKAKLFSSIVLIEPSDFLKKILERGKLLPLTTEKARSEAIVFPVLAELKENNKESSQQPTTHRKGM